MAEAQNFVFRQYIMVTDTVEEEGVTLPVSSDDAEQEDDAIDALYDDDLDAGWEGAPEDQKRLTTGLRFRNIAIPQGATIDSAFLIVYSHEGKSVEDVARITIAGEAADHALTFTETALLTDRPRTSATQLWEVAEAWDIWQPYRTPDIRHILQEIVQRNGWQSGNALALFLLGENQGVTEVENAREFESFENISDPEDGGDGQNHPERRPRLVIYYSSGSTSVKTLFHSSVKTLKLYPNPTQPGVITLELDTEEAAEIRLFDARGRWISLQKSAFGKNIAYHTGHLPSGIYYIQAVQGRELYAQRLIVR